MMDWIRKLFGSGSDDGDRSAVDRSLLFELRQELKECERLYRIGARLCVRTCPEKIGQAPQSFPERMLDLHRGLLIKVLVELGGCGRRWDRAEREVAVVLLRHVWGVEVDEDSLAQVLQNVADHAEMLNWESLLRPFVELPPLAEHAAELNSSIMRIANLIAKADGQVLPSEVRSLKSIQAAMDSVLALQQGTRPRTDIVGAGRCVAQLVKTKPTPAENAEDSGKVQAPEEMLAEAMAELDQLIGIESVKNDIRQLVNFLKIEKKREKHGLPRTQLGLHTIFRGNPGTGKTTVARILARLFAGLGILEKGHTIETDRSGLVAEYAGQTGPKVNQRVDEALDGVLFIDEAYSLIAERGDDTFGAEAVQALLKRMEDDRNRLIVVLAGYPRPMERMLRSNPGLASRFQRTFDFPDYTADELVQIFEKMCQRSHYVLVPAAREKLRAGLQGRIACRDEHFGNGRLARNLFEQAIRHMANRIVDVAPLTREVLTTLQAEDICV